MTLLGIPMVLFILDILIIKRCCGFQKSLCQCCIYVACYPCCFMSTGTTNQEKRRRVKAPKKKIFGNKNVNRPDISS